MRLGAPRLFIEPSALNHLAPPAPRGQRLQPTLRLRGGGDLPRRLRVRLRGHHVEAPRLTLPARAGSKIKNPAAPAVRRRIEAEHQTDHQYKANED